MEDLYSDTTDSFTVGMASGPLAGVAIFSFARYDPLFATKFTILEGILCCPPLFRSSFFFHLSFLLRVLSSFLLPSLDLNELTQQGNTQKKRKGNSKDTTSKKKRGSKKENDNEKQDEDESGNKEETNSTEDGGTSSKILLERSCKVLAHEIGHMLGIAHCTYYECLMNGSGHLEEDFRQPLHLCPTDLRKLMTVLERGVVERYEKLLEFYNEVGFVDEILWLRERIKYLKN
jgi:hypothetical protein